MAIANKAVAPGMNLVAHYKGSDYSCETFDERGKVWYRLPNGQTYKSISAAASSITGIPTTNGWMFWSVSGVSSVVMASRSPSATVKAVKPAKADKPRRIRGKTIKEYGVTQEEIDEVDKFLMDTGGYNTTGGEVAGRQYKYPDGCDCGICGKEFPDTIKAGEHFAKVH